MLARKVLAAVTGLLVVTAAGCAREVTGSAQQDPAKPMVTLSQDGAGLVAGYLDAPVQIELYTEPQCRTCAELQDDFGDDLVRYISLGQLAVTYRPVLFSDTTGSDFSSRAENALFLTADAATPATAFQKFVKELWTSQPARGSGDTGPSDAKIADLARDAGVPDDVADRIAKGDTGADVQDDADANLTLLFEVNELDPGTPTVYDMNSGEVLDIYDNNWLSRIMSKA